MIFSRGRGRDEGLGGFSVVGETEPRVSTYLGDGGEVEGPKIAISTSRVSKIERFTKKNSAYFGKSLKFSIENISKDKPVVLSSIY